jgi:hypothetical protein
MYKISLVRTGAGIIGALAVFGISFSFTFAASTIVQDNVKGFVACQTGAGSNNEGCSSGGGTTGDAFEFVDPSISVQYQATVVDSAGQVIPPGGSVSCGTQVTLKCLPHQNNDISWFTPGGTYDSPYGTWETTGSSCTDQF